ncbi:5-hydroxytryptamine receptor 3A-like [Takifugu rubripes]|uniref:5-hydroxytryptamine receptor 3A-like n=1 Tax=Takifugu rubripes TaxID=31033 RepID=UPI001145CA2F|nr:5-hydroxytryptamine receptor 3A-like [Takifugu rubripes]
MMTKGQFRFFCFMLIQGYGAMLNCTSPTPRSLVAALEKDLFPYRQVRPVKDFSSPLNITLDITVVGVLGVDPMSQTLTMLIWQVLEWDIDGLSWDVQECGTEKVSVLRESIWVPDVHIAEFMEEDQSPRTPFVYLYNTGGVFDDRPIRVVSSCKLDIYTFPFDIQNCTLTFGSYVHFASEIRMSQGSTAEDILQESREVFETNGEWDLADIEIAPVTLSLGKDDYSEIKYFLILRRKPLNYVVNLLIPSCFLVTIDIFSFMLPPHSVDRSSFKMTLILGYTVFLLIMNDLLPVTGNQTPLINVFFSVSLALMVASLLETVLITHIQLSSSHGAIPDWLRTLVLQYMAILVCLPPLKKKRAVTVFLNPSATGTGVSEPASSVAGVVSVRGPQELSDASPAEKTTQDSVLEELRKLSRHLAAIRVQVDKHFQGNPSMQEWEMIGRVVDRFLFGLYIIFITVTFITIIAIWIWNNSYAA